MPIGKDSIKTRVAKVAADEPKVEAAKAETPAEVKPAPKKTATKKAAAPKAPKAEGEATAKAPAKKAAPKKPALPKPSVSADKAPEVETPAVAPAVDTAVLANVSPETVAAVIGHDEKKPSDKVQIGQKMPTHLL